MKIIGCRRLACDESFLLSGVKINYNIDKSSEKKKGHNITQLRMFFVFFILKVVFGTIFLQQKRRVLEICGCGPGVKLRSVLRPSH